MNNPFRLIIPFTLHNTYKKNKCSKEIHENTEEKLGSLFQRITFGPSEAVTPASSFQNRPHAKARGRTSLLPRAPLNA